MRDHCNVFNFFFKYFLKLMYSVLQCINDTCQDLKSWPLEIRSIVSSIYKHIKTLIVWQRKKITTYLSKLIFENSWQRELKGFHRVVSADLLYEILVTPRGLRRHHHQQRLRSSPELGRVGTDYLRATIFCLWGNTSLFIIAIKYNTILNSHRE